MIGLLDVVLSNSEQYRQLKSKVVIERRYKTMKFGARLHYS